MDHDGTGGPSESTSHSGALQDQKKECYRCGGNHLAVDCRFKLAICHFCKKHGHIARACMKVKASGYEHVCYSYGHEIQCKQRMEYVFQVG